MEAKDTSNEFDIIKISWCRKHKIYWIWNCPECMAETCEEEGRKAGREQERQEWFLKTDCEKARDNFTQHIIERAYAQGAREVVEWTAREFGVDWSEEKEQLEKWGIRDGHN